MFIFLFLNKEAFSLLFNKLRYLRFTGLGNQLICYSLVDPLELFLCIYRFYKRLAFSDVLAPNRSGDHGLKDLSHSVPACLNLCLERKITSLHERQKRKKKFLKEYIEILHHILCRNYSASCNIIDFVSITNTSEQYRCTEEVKDQISGSYY